jgi:type VI secretion system protein ImpJ
LSRNQHRVVWTKGMFLTPQHFQTQDQYASDALQFRFNASEFCNWGVTELDVDREAVSNGLVRLSRCRGLLPDGEPFQMPGVEDLPASRALAEHFPETQRYLDVFLALPERRLVGRNVTLAETSNGGAAPANTRYISEARMIPDENAGADEKAVQVARRNFRLLFDGEYRDGYSSIRIAQIARNSAGVPVLNDDFVAPCLDLGSSEFLLRVLRRQIEILANKISTLSAGRRQRGKALADFNASETANFWLLHTVNSYLPELRHIYKVRRGHPEGAWGAMLRLAGALSTFVLDANAVTLPDYDHEDLGRCFGELDGRIRDLMDTVIQTNYVPIPLTLTDQFVWSGTVQDDRYFKNSQFYLALSAKMGVDDVIRKVPQLVKVASNGDIQRIIHRALGGITLRHTPAPPAAIPMKLDNQYFSLNQSGPLWDNVQLSRSIAVFAPSEIAEPKMEVIVVLE